MNGNTWLQALGSVAVTLVRPERSQIDFVTMATVLARLPRFGGHTEGKHIYSVGQHSEQGARAIERDTGNKLAAGAFLIHDGHEAYMGCDIPTPTARALAEIAIEETGDLGAGDVVTRAIQSLKERLDSVIYPAAGLPWPLPPDVAAIVKEYDERMGTTERDERMARPPMPYTDRYTDMQRVVGCDLYPWSPEVVASLWLAAARELLPSFC